MNIPSWITSVSEIQNTDYKSMFNTIFSAISDGAFVVTPKGGDFKVTHVNDMLQKLLPAPLLAGKLITDVLPKSDARWMRRALSQTFFRRSPITLNLESHAMRGGTQILRLKLVPIVEHNKVSTIIGTVHILTDRRKMQRTAKLHRDRYAIALEQAPYGVCFIDKTYKPTMVNRAFSNWLDKPTATILQEPLANHIHEDERGLFTAALKKVSTNGKVYRNLELRLISKIGEEIWTSANISHVKDGNSDNSYIILQFVDISKHKKNEEHLIELATKDHLTGLANRLVFEEELIKAMKSARRYSRPGAVLFIDMDDFKQINDMFGHKAGDSTLQKVAHALKVTLRDTDITARIGGDEFAIILQEIEEGEAQSKAKLVHDTLNSLHTTAHGKQVAIRASVGIEIFTGECMRSTDEIVAAADKNMYQAKVAAKKSIPL